MMKSFASRILLFGITLIVAWGCFQDDIDKITNLDTIEWAPGFSAPLVDASISFQDVIDQLYSNSSETVKLDSGADQEIIIVFEESLELPTANELFELPTIQPLTTSLRIDPGDYNTQDTISSPPIEFNINAPDGERVDEVIMSGGNMRVVFNSTIDVPVGVALILPTLQRTDGSSLPSDFPLIANLDPNGTTSFDIDMNEYKLDFRNINGNDTTFNYVSVLKQLFFQSGVTSVTGGRVTVELTITDVDFSELNGRLGQQSVSSGTQSIDLGFFQNVPEADFFLSDPRINLLFNNTFGLPFGVNFNTLTGITASGDSIRLSGSLAENTQVVSAPSIPGESVTDAIVIDNNNSNIAEIISALPTEIIYNIEAITNPINVNNDNFILSESTLTADLIAELLLAGRFNLQYTVENEFDLDLGLGDSLDIKSGTILIRTNNFFPVEVRLALNFKDANGNVLFNPIADDEYLLRAGSVDAQGFVEPSSVEQNDLEIILTDNELDLLPDVALLDISVFLNTAEFDQSENVVFRTIDFIDMKVGANLELEIIQSLNQ